MESEQLRLAAQVFADLPDVRENRGLNHSPVNLIVIALCAVMSGADTFPEIQTFGETKGAWLKSFLSYRRIPDHDTFWRVFAQLNSVHFQSSALDWILQAIGGRLETGDIMSIDGKRLRGTSESEVQGIHMVNAWSAKQGLCLMATAVEGKGNEITTLPSVLDTFSLLEVQGCIVTIDTMGTQREVARRLVELKTDYLLGLKKNQPNLFRDVQGMFDDALRRPIESTALDLAKTEDQRHGRVEHRHCRVLPAAPDLNDHAWPGLRSDGCQQRGRPVLPQLPSSGRSNCNAWDWHALGGGKQTALGARCCLRRRLQPDSDRPWRRKSRRLAAVGTESDAQGRQHWRDRKK